MEVRPYEPDRDLAHVQRTWREVGWIDGTAEQAALVDTFFSAGDALVATIDGEVECAVHRTPGTIRYQDHDLALAAISAVTTSRVARRTGLASRLTARALGDARAEGNHVSALGMFDQGFYDRFGFGSGPYDHRLVFDPASLRVEVPYRRPIRLSIDDHEQMHAALLRRRRLHGAVTLLPPSSVRAELGFIEDFFALGYRDDIGELTHFLAGSAKGEHGPYTITWYCWRTADQLLELLRLLAELGDQVDTVSLIEPPDLQLQDLIDRPFRGRRSESRSEHEAFSWWQLRILDLAACVAALSSPVEGLAFTLRLVDPLAELPDPPWRGIGGEYTIRVGSTCSVEPGSTAGLPTLDASVNAFSRLWFGVRPATQLAVTDALVGPDELLRQLDRAIALPPPRPGWDF